MIFLTSTNYNALVTAEEKISSNCGFPNEAGTLKWADISQAYEQEMWYFPKPPENGFENPGCIPLSQDQMMQDVDMTDIIEQEFDPSWRNPDDD